MIGYLKKITKNIVRHGSLTSNVIRRMGWIMYGLRFSKFINHSKLVYSYLTGKTALNSYPVIVKIETSSLCNLKCTICVHADSDSVEKNNKHLIEGQCFKKTDVMDLERYKVIVDDLKDKVSAVSLYWLGDPLMNKNIVSYCEYAHQNGLGVHVNTNFSFNMSDEQIKSIVTSGITEFTVCVDGFSQDTYSITRVNGNFSWVKNNIERLVYFKKKFNRKDFNIEVQYIKFKHNLCELDDAISWARNLGVDGFYHFWGDLNNYVDYGSDNLISYSPREKGILPKCYWPTYFSVINFNGDVYPCCTYRLDEVNNINNNVDRSFGNVFDEGFAAIWNGVDYQRARTYSHDPGKMEMDSGCNEHFCFNCPSLNYTNWDEIRLSAKDYDFFDIYRTDGRKRVRIERSKNMDV